MGLVQVYRNLHKNAWSVRSKRTGRVLLHSRGIILRDCNFIVREKGRQRVLESGQKGVHAWVEGSFFSIPLLKDIGFWHDPDSELPYRMCSYNPFLGPSFFYTDDMSPVFKAETALLWDKIVYIPDADYLEVKHEKTGGNRSKVETLKAVF